MSSEALALCPARLIVSLAPAPSDAGATRPHRMVLPARSQFVALPWPASYTGRAELSAALVLSHDPSAQEGTADTVLAEDARDVYMLHCASTGATAQNESDASCGSSCLAHGFVPKTHSGGLSAVGVGARRRARGSADLVEPGAENDAGPVNGRNLNAEGGGGGGFEGGADGGGGGGTPRLAHFVFDVKGPPPRCSYFLFVAVRSAVRVLRSEMGEEGGVVVHFHFEPWGPW